MSRFAVCQHPDPFQGTADPPRDQGSCLVSLAEHAADPPNLKTREGQGAQTQLEVPTVSSVDQ